MPTKKSVTPETENSEQPIISDAAETEADPEEKEQDVKETEEEKSAEGGDASKPKRVRKKKEEAVPENQQQSDGLLLPEEPEQDRDIEQPLPQKSRSETILTVTARDMVETEDSEADMAWHEIHTAYRTRRILTGILGGIEQTDTGKTLVVADYKGYRVVIPLKEMVIKLPNDLSGQAYSEMMIGQHKRLTKMLGSEIDFIVRGVDSKERTVVASRRDAMLKKRQIFYMTADENGDYKIYDGRIVQARVIMVMEKAIRVEVFGVECTISARDLSWDWIGDAADRFSVGDRILIRIHDVKRDDIETISVTADVKSVSENRKSKLPLCRVQGKYAGKVTDIHKGVVFIRLSNGVNAIAHTCLDRRKPGKKDDVCFAVTHIDEEQDVAVGIITRIIKQNL